MTRDTEQRKRDHLQLAQNSALNFDISAGFERWRFIHNALPELDLQAVDTSTRFLGKPLSFPLIISSMSGGLVEGFTLNATLAQAAEAVGCALGLGSIRAALEDTTRRDSFLIAREKAPTTVILANLGIAQALDTSFLDPVARFCEALGADGLIIHLNAMQEAFQPEGEPNFTGALAAIKFWVDAFPLPIIIKEVGQGLSPRVIARLEDIGVRYLDVAGAGGSNWINIERERIPRDQVILHATALEFANWGEPTAEVLENLASGAVIVASGGLRSPMDMAKALALGANLVGVAGPFLKAGLSGNPHILIDQLRIWQNTLKMVMFGTGCQSLENLIGNRSLLMKQDRRV